MSHKTSDQDRSTVLTNPIFSLRPQSKSMSGTRAADLITQQTKELTIVLHVLLHPDNETFLRRLSKHSPTKAVIRVALSDDRIFFPSKNLGILHIGHHAMQEIPHEVLDQWKRSASPERSVFQRLLAVLIHQQLRGGPPVALHKPMEYDEQDYTRDGEHYGNNTSSFVAGCVHDLASILLRSSKHHIHCSESSTENPNSRSCRDRNHHHRNIDLC